MNKEFNKGLSLAGFGSFWWGFFGVIYFKYIAYIHTPQFIKIKKPEINK